MTETEHIFERLRSGTVPERGLDKFAVGIDRLLTEIRRQLDIAESGDGAFKFLRGGYGCGKTFMSQYTVLEALRRNFAVSFVVVSPNDTQFHRFDDVYHKIVSGLRTPTAASGALEDSVDRWIGRIEDRLAEEIGEDDPGFDDAVKARFDTELGELSRSDTGVEFINVLKAFFDAKLEEDYATASSLIGWISGSKNIAASAKRKAGVKGEISSSSALLYLKGVLNIIRKAGYAGLVVVIDELETILRTRGDVGVVPRQFLRELISVMDLVEENDGSDGGPAYDPAAAYHFDGPSFAPPEPEMADDADDASVEW